MSTKKLKHQNVGGSKIGEHEVDLPSNTLHMNICEYKEGSKSEHHRHAYEAILYIVEGEGHTMISGEKIDWKAGDAVYISPWEWHQHFALKNSKVVSCTNENLFKNISPKKIIEIKEKAS